MAIVQSDIAIKYANQVMALVQELRTMRTAIQEIVTINTNTPLGNLWNALNTTLLAADGGLGTADTPGTPVNAHYIDPRVYPALSRVVKNTDLGNALQLLVDLNTFCNGTALSLNGARPANINAVAE